MPPEGTRNAPRDSIRLIHLSRDLVRELLYDVGNALKEHDIIDGDVGNPAFGIDPLLV